MNIPWKIYQGRQSSCPLGVEIKGIARVFNWLKCLGGIMHLKPTAGRPGQYLWLNPQVGKIFAVLDIFFMCCLQGTPQNRNIKVVYRDSSRHISGEQRGAGHYADVTGSRTRTWQKTLLEYYTTPRTNKITPQGESPTFNLMSPVTSLSVTSHPVAMLLPGSPKSPNRRSLCIYPG
jgi:hypothetical protein